MRVTTSGEIHKNNVIIESDVVDTFLKKQKHQFDNLCEKKNVVYNRQNTVVDTTLNYFNINPDNKVEESLKNIVLSEFYHCERIYPYLGDYLIHSLYSKNKIKRGSSFVFQKRHQNKLLSSFRNNETYEIASWFFENGNLNRTINIEKYQGSDIAIEGLEEFIFKIDYDFSFYTSLNQKEVKNYRFVLINGIIESIGEIHHLLYRANDTKEPYVIFCFGMSEEVKQTINKNNALGRLRVYPVCLNSNDVSTLNILNDLAVIHNSSVVSSDLGQTISQVVSKELPYGNKITFFNGGLSLIPVASKNNIETHRRFLQQRLANANAKEDVRQDVLENRLKMFTGKRINIYIPEILLNKTNVKREIDYYFRLISNLDKKIKVVDLNNNKFYIPSSYIKIADEKKNSLLTKLDEIKAIIV